MRFTNSQIAFSRFNVAVNSGYGDNQRTDFISVMVWRKQAENVCNYLDKGSLISVEGRIQTGSYDNQEGKKVYTFDVVADNIQFLESKKSGTVNGTVKQNVDPYSFQSDIDPYSTMQDQLSINLDDCDID